MLPLIDVIAKKTKVQVIDLYTPMLGKNSLAPDGIHPNADGTAILANEVYKVIRK